MQSSRVVETWAFEGGTPLVESPVDQLGASMGATRVIVDAGGRPCSGQAGQTSKTIQPTVYIAVGI